MVDWEAPEGERLAVARGELGEVSISGDAFEAELRGPTALLDAAGGRADLARMPRRARRQEVPGRHGRRGRGRRGSRRWSTTDVVEVEEAAPGNAYGYGRLRWIGGANSGLDSAILRSDGTHG